MTAKRAKCWFRRGLLWLFDNVPLGPLAPWVLGLALGRWPRRTA
jgi:hypothetical protein